MKRRKRKEGKERKGITYINDKPLYGVAIDGAGAVEGGIGDLQEVGWRWVPAIPRNQ